jgi:Neuraminidase (sialidase)
MIDAPLVGPSWEICHSIVETPRGRWLAPTSTWRAWDGGDYEGDRAVVLISDDRGQTWRTFGTSFDGRKTQLSYLEQSVISFDEETVLAVSWVYELEKGASRPTVYSVSKDGGATFSEPRATGLSRKHAK